MLPYPKQKFEPEPPRKPGNVKEILHDWLKANGYGGLVSDGAECGCELDDLAPCDGCFASCEPGYKVACKPDCEHDFDWVEGAWHIQNSKPVN